MTLNKETKSYRDSLLVASNVYLLLGLALGLFTSKEVHRTFASKSSYIQEGDLELNEVFNAFVQRFLKVSLLELLPFVQYSSLFYNVPLDRDGPSEGTGSLANVGEGLLGLQEAQEDAPCVQRRSAH